MEVHAFNRDVDDTNDRISEKSVILNTEDNGKDLTQVQTLQRKQENIKRDMSAVETKIREHESNARNLSKKYPDKNDSIYGKLEEVITSWEKLCTLSSSRQNTLSESYTLHKFLSELRDLEKWSEDMITRMNASPLPNNTAEADMLLQSHQERKVSILFSF